MNYACKVTPEQKKDVWKRFNALIAPISGYREKEREHSSYPNLYFNNTYFKELNQTSHEEGHKYFKWVSLPTFERMLINALIEKVKIKL